MSIADIKKWCRMHERVVGRGRTVESVYLRGGHAFSNDPLPESDLDTVTRVIFQTGYTFKPGECYMNAGRIALNTELAFCEGLAMGPFPVEHGWNVFNGRAIDVTWPTQWRKPDVYVAAMTQAMIRERIKFNISNCFYWGIEVATIRMRDHVLGQKAWRPTVSQLAINKERASRINHATVSKERTP